MYVSKYIRPIAKAFLGINDVIYMNGRCLNEGSRNSMQSKERRQH